MWGWWSLPGRPGRECAAPVGYVTDLLEARRLLAVSPAAGVAETPDLVEWQGGSVPTTRGQWILRLDAPSRPRGAADALQTVRSAVRSRRGDLAVTGGLGLTGLWLLDAPAEESYERLHTALRGLPGYRYVQPNFVYSVQDTLDPTDDAIPPSDPHYAQQWALNNTGASGGVADADIDAPEAWAEFGTGDDSVVVAVIDTGIDYTHPDLVPNLWRNPFETPGDRVDNDNNGFIDDVYGADFVNNDGAPLDDYGHGTHCAGIIAAAADNGIGVAGVAWRTKVMGLKFLGENGSGTGADAIRALAYAVDMRRRGVNVRVTSNSYGGDPYDQAFKDAIEASTRAGILFVASAGNSNHDNDLDGPGSGTAFPASFDSPDIISVAASDRRDAKAGFSSFGRRSVDLFAPGVDVLSTTTNTGTLGNPSRYLELSGTSMAGPHVAGVAALVFSRKPYLSPAAVKHAILAGVDPIAAFQNLAVTGGRLNALGALRRMHLAVLATDPAAGDYVPDPPPTEYTVRFTEPIEPDGLQPSDFRVGPTAAEAVTLSGDAMSATFRFSRTPITSEGPWLMRMDEGAVSAAADEAGLQAFEAHVYYDLHRGRVLSITPAEGSTIGLETDLDVRFDEPVGAGWIGTDDLVLSAGAVTAASRVAPDTVRYHVASSFETALRVVLPDDVALDVYGNPVSGAATWFDVDVATAPLPGGFAPFGVGAAQGFAGDVRARLQSGDDVDRYTFAPGAGRVMAVELVAPDRVELNLALLDPAGNAVAAGAAGPGMITTLGPMRPTTAGDYTAVITSKDPGAPGAVTYRLRVLLDMDVEPEGRGGASDDTRETARDLGPMLAPLPGGAGASAAVTGRNDAPVASQYMLFEREPNDGLGTANAMSDDLGPPYNEDPNSGRGPFLTTVAGSLDGPDDVDWYRVHSYDVTRSFLRGSLIAEVAGASSGRGTLADPLVRAYRRTAARCSKWAWTTIPVPVATRAWVQWS